MEHKLSIIGFGSQAQAWAQNLALEKREFDVLVRERSPSLQKLKVAGYRYFEINSKTLSKYNALALLIPDHLHAEFINKYAKHLKPQTLVILAHGHSYSTHNFLKNYPHLNFALLAPKGIASELIKRKAKNLPLGGVWDLQTTKSFSADLEQKFIQDLARDLGLTHLYKSSFEEETKADLLSEQSLLCGLIPYAAKQTFDKMRSAGISKELAFMECWMELQMITDALVSKGPAAFFKLISPNALLGSEQAQNKFKKLNFQDALNELWSEIENGDFTKACQNLSLDEVTTATQKDWESSQLQETYEELKELVQDNEINA